MSRDRLLVIDANLPKRLATYLTLRSRRALSAAELGLGDELDPDVLRLLAERFAPDEWVLVTGDDAMPAEHGPVIVETSATIATIHPSRPEGVDEVHWYYDVVQRWAHVMQEQAPGDVRRYSMRGAQVWRPRRKHARQIRERGWTPWTPPRG